MYYWRKYSHSSWKKIPPRSLVVSSPRKVVRELNEKDLELIQLSIDTYVKKGKDYSSDPNFIPVMTNIIPKECKNHRLRICHKYDTLSIHFSFFIIHYNGKTAYFPINFGVLFSLKAFNASPLS